MKIALVINSMPLGGAERVLATMSFSLAKENEVSVIIFDGSNNFFNIAGNIIDLKIKAKNNNFFSKVIAFIKIVFKLKKTYKENNFDKIISFMEAANFASILTTRKVIVSAHLDPQKLSLLNRISFMILYRFAKKIVAVSKGIEDVLNKKYYLKNITTIYNSIPCEYVNLDLSTQNSADDNLKDKFILSVGRLHYQKGFDLLIEAYYKSSIKDKVNLIIIGDGLERKKLEKKILDLKLDNKIRLLGAKKDIRPFYKKCMFFVMPSRLEGFGNTLIESLACGSPCIAFKNFGPNEIISNENNGLLVETNNITKLSIAMDKLYQDKHLYNKMKQNTQESIKRFYPDNIIKKWLEL